MSNDVEILAETLTDGTPQERIQTLTLLAGLGDLAAPASVSVLDCLADDSESIREYATETLENMGPPRLQDAGQISERLNNEHAETAYWSATLLGRLRSNAADFVPHLMTALDHSASIVKERSAWALGRIGSLALPASPKLEEIAKSDEPRLSRLASQALESINK